MSVLSDSYKVGNYIDIVEVITEIIKLPSDATKGEIMDLIMSMPPADVVHRKYYDQITSLLDLTMKTYNNK